MSLGANGAAQHQERWNAVPLYHLMYHSHSALPCSDGPPIGDLGILLEECFSYNAAHAITGILAFHDDRFLQIIEGPEAEVDHLYAGIRRDPRHHCIELVLRAPCDVRRFDRWSMAFAYRDMRLPSVFRYIAAQHSHAQALSVVGTLAEMVA